MSEFDRRWRRLVRAASRAGDVPLPPAPDGSRLWRLAAARTAPARPRAQLVPLAVGLALLWAVALPLAGTAGQTARDLLALVAHSAPAPACCASLPRLPSWPSIPALARPRLPPLPDLRLPRGDRSSEAPAKETPS